ncbi:hypothetical protein PENSPDRAFT_695273 [Peniophora sp. CONT]|nr:hypothetical protein PENSPDRAFT_695273 [Peniophora sp. CONT]
MASTDSESSNGSETGATVFSQQTHNTASTALTGVTDGAGQQAEVPAAAQVPAAAPVPPPAPVPARVLTREEAIAASRIFPFPAIPVGDNDSEFGSIHSSDRSSDLYIYRQIRRERPRNAPGSHQQDAAGPNADVDGDQPGAAMPDIAEGEAGAAGAAGVGIDGADNQAGEAGAAQDEGGADDQAGGAGAAQDEGGQEHAQGEGEGGAAAGAQEHAGAHENEGGEARKGFMPGHKGKAASGTSHDASSMHGMFDWSTFDAPAALHIIKRHMEDHTTMYEDIATTIGGFKEGVQELRENVNKQTESVGKVSDELRTLRESVDTLSDSIEPKFVNAMRSVFGEFAQSEIGRGLVALAARSA